MALALALVVLAACSSEPKPPPHAGTLIVHAVFAAGPVGPGYDPVAHGSPITNTKVRVRASPGSVTMATTDDHGDAKFVVAPGAYIVHLADLMGFDGRGGSLDCGGGGPHERVRVPPDDTARATLACFGAG